MFTGERIEMRVGPLASGWDASEVAGGGKTARGRRESNGASGRAEWSERAERGVSEAGG